VAVSEADWSFACKGVAKKTQSNTIVGKRSKERIDWDGRTQQ
jgi:hypothetical protein